MPLLDLPLELFQCILYHSIRARGIKHGLELRLVNSFFATQIPQTLSHTHLLDPSFLCLKPRFNPPLPPFAATYLCTRILNEPRTGGLPPLLFVRGVAQRLAQEEEHANDSTAGRDTRAFVAELCRAILVDRLPHRIADLFDPELRPATAGHIYEKDVYVAAVYTQCMPLVRRYVALGKNPSADSWLFGSARQHAARSSNVELLAMQMRDPRRGNVCFRRRAALFADVVKFGDVEATRFVYNFGVEQVGWRFYPECQDMYARKARAVLAETETLRREVEEFLGELRRVHLGGEEGRGRSAD